jgi:Deacetylase PdaC/Protein of unknown function (DUF3298)
MKKNLLFAAASIMLLLAACNNTAPTIPQNVVSVEALTFETIKDSLIDKRIEIRVEYQKAKGKNSEIINEMIMKTVCHHLTMGDSASAKLRDHKQMFAYLQKIQKESYPDSKEYADMPPWGFDLLMSKDYQSETFLSLGFTQYSGAGGAHPNTYAGFLNIDLNTNKTLLNTELVDSVKIMPIVEAAFQEHWKTELQGSKKYEEKGFFIENDKLPLPVEIGMTAENVIFFYNPYEIGAYVMGSTELTIPRSKLEGMIKVK